MPFTSFASLSRDALNEFPADPLMDPSCTGAWRSSFESRIGINVTDPAKIQTVLRYMQLDRVQEMRSTLGALLTSPQPFSQYLDQAETCAAQNKPVLAYLCAVNNVSSIGPHLEGRNFGDALIRNELIDALHLGIVLEEITKAAVESPQFRSQLTWRYAMIGTRTFGLVVRQSREEQLFRQWFLPQEATFKTQKWQSVEPPTREHDFIRLKRGDNKQALAMQLGLATNILEAVSLELRDGIHPNAELGTALAIGAVGPTPYINDDTRQWKWPLGKAWVDAYIAWNLEYVSRFETVHHFPKLIIPSVACNVPDVYAEDFVNARAISLKVFLVYWTYRREYLTQQGVESMEANGVVNTTRAS